LAAATFVLFGINYAIGIYFFTVGDSLYRMNTNYLKYFVLYLFCDLHCSSNSRHFLSLLKFGQLDSLNCTDSDVRNSEWGISFLAR